jgi:anthranilate 1,2-dioxygenase small subunit
VAQLLTDPDQCRAVLDLLQSHADCLDEDRLEDWPSLFVPDGRYLILSRENEALNLPAPLMYMYSRNMMQDRVTAIRDALTFEYVYTRHIVSPPRLAVSDDGAILARSSFSLYQTTEEGVTRLFCVGGYQDQVVASEDSWLFSERRVVVDTFGIQNLIAVPL